MLLVEDYPHVAATTIPLLEILGHEVKWAATGQEAIDLALAEKPDMLIIDIGLPDINGHEVAKRLRTLLEDSIFVALTGYDCEAESMRSGFDHHFKKPLKDYRVLSKLTRRLI
jgi:CheY-like chemotaxis protein